LNFANILLLPNSKDQTDITLINISSPVSHPHNHSVNTYSKQLFPALTELSCWHTPTSKHASCYNAFI